MRIKTYKKLFVRIGEIQPCFKKQLYYKVIIGIYNMLLTYSDNTALLDRSS